MKVKVVIRVNKLIPFAKTIFQKVQPANTARTNNISQIFNNSFVTPAIDTFERTTGRKISIEDVKKLFPDAKIDADDIRDEMYKIKRVLFFSSFKNLKDFKKFLHSVNLSKKLKTEDFNEIKDFMNLHDGAYINLWKGYSEFDDIPNIQKLALFVRSIKRIEKLNYYKSLPKEQWECCINGIINKPNYVIEPLMKYKFDSSPINSAITDGTNSLKIKSQIKAINSFLEKQKINTDMIVYRGEGSFNIFGKAKNGEPPQLGDILEKFTKEIETQNLNEDVIQNFINDHLITTISQKRFLSTAIDKEAGERYAQKVFWNINVPKGTKGSMIESYNVERESEAELLLQQYSKLKIKKAKYDKANKRWELWADLKQ